MELLTPKEVSQILRCKPGAIYKWAGEGKLSAYKIGGLLRFDKEEVEKFIKQCKITIKPIRDIAIKTVSNNDIDKIVESAIKSTLKS